MKRVILFLTLCLIMTQPAAASFDLEDLLPDLISKGFDRILESQADNIYDIIGVNSSNAQPAVSTLMAQKNDFLSNPMVQKQKNFTSFWYFVFYIIFLLAGGIGVMKESASFDTMGNAFGNWRNKYFEIAIIAPLVWAFYLYGLQWIFSLESILAKSAFLESMNFVSYSPDNSMAYLLRALSFVSLMIIFYFRYLVVGIISAYFLLFAAAGFFPLARSFALTIFMYGAVMLFSRFLMCLILLGGTGLMSGLPYPLNESLLLYYVITQGALLAGLLCILYPVLSLFGNQIKYLVIGKYLFGSGRRSR
ncbi:MAG: hypothetical protein MPEBLZ_03607 [Candidatus Methanoperedens nitroreducens]|uniref:Transmembrane protein n=1 Tax=Candidatus Methanoperedens nitratireducens TaxID=1392998 RepID=A0A0P8A5L0_9EURY|nr:hypothetical protein [Candidatus Methanoperedens sp. BLZ2]KAB2946991.1 MAG: hypothetical protein F9K14_06020 [Candidatus Methanoperedens sp.]KPQ41848.1 MAG: hypothetical protein MPEBLZ_03607 [Candidatus Methanoperedens sp. BLZ1]MBZ0176794.1 hypothetical protein [Candidatus Methanoperedens nitroreducens]MCX9080516.1 hypothetical protein [Candidatus Methanoperedens sp.]